MKSFLLGAMIGVYVGSVALAGMAAPRCRNEGAVFMITDALFWPAKIVGRLAVASSDPARAVRPCMFDPEERSR